VFIGWSAGLEGIMVAAGPVRADDKRQDFPKAYLQIPRHP
jgi:hypothetical protein